MDYYDEHDEDDLPEILLTMPKYTREISNDNDEQKTKALENWRDLYEASIHSLKTDEENIPKPFYLEPLTPTYQSPNETPDSSIHEFQIDSNINEHELDSNTNKSKWEIRLPELLNSTVGPDRQKRDVSRRHTTDIVFQQSRDLKSNSEVNRRTNPLVKQLKQKFDKMIMTNTTIDDSTNHLQIKKLQRVGSLTCRGSTANTTERVIQRPRPALPIRFTPEITPVKSRSGSVGSKNNQTTVTNKRNNRDKSGPPISYTKHHYPPPSIASVVKQFIGNGATLVYDSNTQNTTSKTKPSIIKHQRNFEQTKEDLKNTNTLLLGRQISPDYAKIQKPFKSKEDESDENYYEPIMDQTTYNSSRSISIEAPTGTYNGHKNPNTNERRNHYSTYDMNRKK